MKHRIITNDHVAVLDRATGVFESVLGISHHGFEISRFWRIGDKPDYILNDLIAWGLLEQVHTVAYDYIQLTEKGKVALEQFKVTTLHE